MRHGAARWQPPRRRPSLIALLSSSASARASEARASESMLAAGHASAECTQRAAQSVSSTRRTDVPAKTPGRV